MLLKGVEAGAALPGGKQSPGGQRGRCQPCRGTQQEDGAWARPCSQDSPENLGSLLQELPQPRSWPNSRSGLLGSLTLDLSIQASADSSVTFSVSHTYLPGAEENEVEAVCGALSRR